MAEITLRVIDEEQILHLLKAYYLKLDAFLDIKIQPDIGYWDQCKADC